MKKSHLLILLFLLPAWLSIQAFGQSPGDNDPSFNPDDIGFGNGDRFNRLVTSLSLQTDGKILLAGGFSSYNGTVRRGVARLNADGSLDTGFDPGSGFEGGAVQFITSQADGKILVGGGFTSYNGTAINRMARLNPDGSLDTSFDPGSGIDDGLVQFIAPQAGGKILIGGRFTSYNGTARNRIARLNADGSLDTSFDPGTGFGGSTFTFVRSIVLQADGKVLVGGGFSSYNDTVRHGIVRLNTDGSLDASFDSGSGFNSSVQCLSLQPDGKILVGGFFTNYNGTEQNRIVRLNTDGSLDPNFNSGSGFNNTPLSFALSADGKILVGGSFVSYDGITRMGVARLDPNGHLDSGFDPGSGSGGSRVEAIALQADGKLLVGGLFNIFNGVARNRIARLNADGSLGAGFEAGTGFNDLISAAAPQADGKILVGGNFSSYNNVTRNRIVRLNADGSLDNSFDPGSGFDNNSITSIALQPDGKLLVGGWFSRFNDTIRRYITRLNTDGSLDASFDPGGGFNGPVEVLVLQPDGKILVGGRFTNFNNTWRNQIARLHEDGSLDISFDLGSGFDGGRVHALTLQADGKILVGGFFTSYNGTARNWIARLHTDGSLDTSFDPGTGFSGSGSLSSVRSLALQADDKILVGGWFSSFDGSPRSGIARLHADGSLDTSFDPGSGFSGSARSFVQLPNGQIMVGGVFSSYNGTSLNGIALLNSNGTLDTNLDIGSGFDSWVEFLIPQADNKVVAGGNFTSYDGIGRNRIARLFIDPVSALTHEELSHAVEVFPNPSSGYFTVRVHTPTASQLHHQLLNTQGAKLGGAQLVPFEAHQAVTLDLRNQPAGLYFLQVITPEGQRITKKLIKQ